MKNFNTKTSIYVVFALALLFLVACGSHDDGTVFVQEIGNVSQNNIDSGLYGGKFKVELKDRDNLTSWIYTDTEYTLGDSLSLVSMSQIGVLADLKTSNVQLRGIRRTLTATVEQAIIHEATQDSIINALRSELSTKTGQLAEAVNFKTQVKALIAAVEGTETPAATVESETQPDFTIGLNTTIDVPAAGAPGLSLRRTHKFPASALQSIRTASEKGTTK